MWETAYGLDPRSGAGDEGPDGDVDDDGFSNRAEFSCGDDAGRPPPPGLGESSAGDGQRMFPCFRLAPAGQAPGPVRIRSRDNGRQQIPRLDSGGGCGLESDVYVADRVVGVEVESRDPIVVERELGSERDGHLAAGRAVTPSTEWHFAEGPSLGPVDVFLLAYNPSPSPVSATFTYYRTADEDPVITERRLEPGRTTVWINVDEPTLTAATSRWRYGRARRLWSIAASAGSRPGGPPRTSPPRAAHRSCPRAGSSPTWTRSSSPREELVVANPNEVGTLVRSPPTSGTAVRACTTSSPSATRAPSSGPPTSAWTRSWACGS